MGTNSGLNSYNLFAYCGNNPVCCSDPSGCISIWLVALVALAAIGADHYFSQNHPDGYAEQSSDLGYGFSEKLYYAEGAGFNLDKEGVRLCDFETGAAKYSYQGENNETASLNLASASATMELEWSGVPSLDISGVASMSSIEFEHIIPVFSYDVIVTSEFHLLGIGGGLEFDVESARFKVMPPSVGIVTSYGVNVDRR